METQTNEKYFNYPVHTKLHDHSRNAHERIGVLLAEGAPKDCKWMCCQFCGTHYAWEKGDNGKYPTRHYECPQCQGNALFWTKQEDRSPFWAVLMLNRMNELMVQECHAPELADELNDFQGILRLLIEYVRDPHSTRWGSGWVGFLAVAFSSTITVRDFIGKTPRLKTIWHMLSHLEEYDPKAKVQRNSLDDLADSVAEVVRLSNPHRPIALHQ